MTLPSLFGFHRIEKCWVSHFASLNTYILSARLRQTAANVGMSPSEMTPFSEYVTHCQAALKLSFKFRYPPGCRTEKCFGHERTICESRADPDKGLEIVTHNTRLETRRLSTLCDERQGN